MQRRSGSSTPHFLALTLGLLVAGAGAAVFTTWVIESLRHRRVHRGRLLDSKRTRDEQNALARLEDEGNPSTPSEAVL